MKSDRFRSGLFAALSLAIVGLPALAWGQTNYIPYTFTTRTGTPSAMFLFYHPNDVAVDGSNNLYVANTWDHTIHKLIPTGTNWVGSVFAGSSGLSGTNDGVGSAARFNRPKGVAVDSFNNVYVADTDNHTIRKITPGGLVSTLAGVGGSSGFTNGAPNLARFSGPREMTVDSANTIYVSDYGNNRIRTIAPNGTVSTVTNFAGSALLLSGGLAVDSVGNLYISSEDRIRRLTPLGVLSTIAGVENVVGSADGTNSAARFGFALDVAVDRYDDLYVADSGNHTIRKLTQVGTNWVVRTLAGAPGYFITTDGTGKFAGFRNPQSVTVDRSGTVYVAEEQDGLVRVGKPFANSWTYGNSGKWEDGPKWSAGSPSVADGADYITNDLTKVVIIDNTTAAGFSDSMTINNLAVAAPDGSDNILFLHDAGTTPLRIHELLFIDSGGNVILSNSSAVVEHALAVGHTNGNASLNILAGSVMADSYAFVGYQDAGQNAAYVTGPNAAWSNQNALVVGYNSASNQLFIEQGGAVIDGGSGIVGDNGDNNVLGVADAGSVLRNAGGLIVGDDIGNGNQLLILRGGEVHVGYGDNSALEIGTGGNSNLVLVAGSGSLLNCSGPLQLVWGTATSFDDLNVLNIADGGTVVTPSLVVSNGNFVVLSGGTLNTGGTIVDNSLLFPVGYQTNVATLHLNGGVHSFANGMEVRDHSFLTGCGTINGPVHFAPGATILTNCGTLVFTGPVTNDGTIVTINGTNVIFQGGLVNNGTIITNSVVTTVCPNLVTGSIANLPDSDTYVVTDGTNSVQFNWSYASRGNSGYVYVRPDTAVAVATGVTNINQVTNATIFIFATANFAAVGPVNDAGANGGIGEFVILRNKFSGHYAAVRVDDIQTNDTLKGTWWFQTQSGVTNFACITSGGSGPPPPATNFTMQAAGSNLTLSFNTQPGHAYTVQMRTNLTTGPWTSLTNIPGNGSTRTVSLPVNRPQGYYRILTQ